MNIKIFGILKKQVVLESTADNTTGDQVRIIKIYNNIPRDQIQFIKSSVNFWSESMVPFSVFYWHVHISNYCGSFNLF